MRPVPAPVGPTPPVPAIAAAVLGVLSAFVPAVFALVAFAFAGGSLPGVDSLLLVVPLVLAVGLLVGTVLLLMGRSWLALAIPAGVTTVLLLYGYASGGRGGGGFGVLTLVVPAATTVLAALPRVRHWVAARRATRAGAATRG